MNHVKKVEVSGDFQIFENKAKSQVEQVPFSQVAFSKASKIRPGSLSVLVKK